MDLADWFLTVTPEVGHGSHSLVEVELLFVIFILGLLCGVLGMTAFFVWFNYRQQQRNSFPAETERLLAEFEDDVTPEIRPKEPEENRAKPEEPKTRDPWEKEPDWWRRSS